MRFDSTLWTGASVAQAIDDMGFEGILLDVQGLIFAFKFNLVDLSPEELKPAKDGASKEVLVSIQGMTCHSCVRTIEDTLGEKEGIRSISVDLQAAQGFSLLLCLFNDIFRPSGF